MVLTCFSQPVSHGFSAPLSLSLSLPSCGRHIFPDPAKVTVRHFAHMQVPVAQIRAERSRSTKLTRIIFHSSIDSNLLRPNTTCQRDCRCRFATEHPTLRFSQTPSKAIQHLTTDMSSHQAGHDVSRQSAGPLGMYLSYFISIDIANKHHQLRARARLLDWIRKTKSKATTLQVSNDI
jgi:hypothetical protein